MDTLTMVWSVEDEQFDVLLRGRWVGRVWSDRDWWTAQDFDGDTEPGFSNFLSAGQFVVSMSGGMVW
jgi:hypothetical protein